jgi:hypothetical protein
MCEKTSLPLPLSPVIKTEISVGATWLAIFMALFNNGELPIMPKRCFISCISMPPSPLKGE